MTSLSLTIAGGAMLVISVLSSCKRCLRLPFKPKCPMVGIFRVPIANEQHFAPHHALADK